MGRLDNFEERMDRAMDNAAGAIFRSTLNPVQILKRACKEMNREKLVSAGKQYAPTLYNILVNEEDDKKLSGFYPTLSGEIETAIVSQAEQQGLAIDGAPLVRFIVDDGLKRGKFDVIAENVAAPIIAQLRQEEMERYGLAAPRASSNAAAYELGVNRSSQRSASQAERRGSGAYVERNRRAGTARQRNRPRPEADYNPQRVVRENYAAAGAGAIAAAGALGDVPLADVPGFDEPYDGRDRVGGMNLPVVDEPFDTWGGSVKRNPVPTLADIRTGTVFELDPFRTSIGRERNNNIAIHDANVSRSHCEIVLEGGIWVIRDLGSTNGTFLNDEPVVEAELYDGDIITIGLTNLEFREA